MIYSSRWDQRQKKSKRKTKYDESYHEKYSFIARCSKSVNNFEFKFHCTTCNTDLSCAHGGIYDVEIHVKSDKHKDAGKNLQSKYANIL